MAVPISQMWTVATLRAEAEACRAQALPARPHAGAAVPLQPGLRRLRKDPVSGPHPEEGTFAGRVLQRGGRVRRADGLHPRRRAADAPADRRDRRRPGRAQEIHLPLHQRAAAEGKAGPVQAEQVSDFFRPHGRPARAPRFLRLPRRRLRHGRRGHPSEAVSARLPRDHQHHAVRRRRSRTACAPSSTK